MLTERHMVLGNWLKERSESQTAEDASLSAPPVLGGHPVLESLLPLYSHQS